MTTTLRKDDIVLVGWVRGGRAQWVGVEPRCHVFGNMFGPMLLVVDADLDDAFDEWDDRHGHRVDRADYADAADVDAALASGEARYTSGGDLVEVDHYEWVRSFWTPAEAGQFFREGWM